MKIYVAVGFKVTKANSVFYRKEKVETDKDHKRFMEMLETDIRLYEPDVISMRIVKEE